MATAKLNREYAMRLCGVAVVMLGLTIWSLYDGLYAWPKVNDEYRQVQPLLLDSAEKGCPPEIWLNAPKKLEGHEIVVTNEFMLRIIYNGIGAKVPRRLVEEIQLITKPEGNTPEAIKGRAEQAVELFKNLEIYPESKIRTQYVQAAVTFILALLAFWSVLSKRKKEYVADDEGLRGSAIGYPVKWDDIAFVDWNKWDKGIISIRLKNQNKIVIDGWHFAGVRDIAEVIKTYRPQDNPKS